MDDNNSEEKALAHCQKLYEALKNNDPNYSLEKRATMVRYLEKQTCPTYFYFEKNGKRSIKKRVKGFKDKRHFFEHIEKFLRDEAERLLDI